MISKTIRLILAFLLAPLVAAIPFIVMAFQEPMALRNVDNLGPLILFIVFALVISYGATLVIGLPAYLLLRHFGWYSLITITCVGSCAPVVVMLISGVPAYELFESGSGFFPMSILGGAVAFTFGLLTMLDWQPLREKSKDSQSEPV